MTQQENVQTKSCAYCLQMKPMSDFKRRSGKRRGAAARRGACRACREDRMEGKRQEVAPATEVIVETVPYAGLEEGEDTPAKKRRKRHRRSKKKAVVAENAKAIVSEPLVEASSAVESPIEQSEESLVAPTKKKRKRRRSKKGKTIVNIEAAAPAAPAVKLAPIPITPQFLKAIRAIGLNPTRGGIIRMRGKTDNGRRWYQEIEPDLAYTLVKEHAAVVLNHHTILRLYSNKEFRRMILERDQYTCYFCKKYGDTIDHMLPRAKGGHTTPDNCVCACNLCNQSKADKDLEDFMNILDLG